MIEGSAVVRIFKKMYSRTCALTAESLLFKSGQGMARNFYDNITIRGLGIVIISAASINLCVSLAHENEITIMNWVGRAATFAFGLFCLNQEDKLTGTSNDKQISH